MNAFKELAKTSNKNDDKILIEARSKICEASCEFVEFIVLKMLFSILIYKKRLLEDESLIKFFVELAFVQDFKVFNKTNINTRNSKQR